MSDFINDLKEGKKTERLLGNILLIAGITGVTYNNSQQIEQLKKYDLMYYNRNCSTPVLIEVKADSRSKYTNNYAIECRYNDNDSGINSTESDYYAILNDKTFNIIKISTLKELCNSNYYKCIEMKSTNTFCYLIPCSDIEQESVRINIKDYIN